MRLAFEAAGARCTFSSEWDKQAQRTYFENFGDEPAGDIRAVDVDSIPDHDILVGGFPCQPFSIAGVSKKNAIGQEHGFQCKTQGTLFFDIARIIETKQPRAFMLENVRNLQRHDKGKTFATILSTLEDELGYQVSYKVINGKRVVPQNRERIYIVGSRPGLAFNFPTDADLVPYRKAATIGEILQHRVDSRYTLTKHLWEYLQAYAEKHRKAGNGFGFGLIDRGDTARTLSARYYKDGSEILIRQRGKRPRRLTPRECARLMGFPESFKIPVSDTQAYKQFGNSVVVPVVQAIAERLVDCVRHDRVGAPAEHQYALIRNGTAISS
ncbi:MAG: DNA (cytosine-5-)-methyltransferase [Phycisphaerales bacterium]